MFIREVIPSIILNSRKERTIQIEIKTFNGWFFSSAPSGKSRGKREVEPYHPKGIDASFERLKLFSKKIVNRNFMIRELKDLQIIRDEIEAFQKIHGFIGGNVLYALETVFLKAAAAEKKIGLWEFIHKSVSKGKEVKIPMPVGNCIGGGAHSKLMNGKKPDFQEFLLIPDTDTFSKAVTLNLKAYGEARKLLRTDHKNDENAWMTSKTNEEALDVLSHVAKKYGLRIGLDFASSSFFKERYYNYKNKGLIRDRVDQIDYITNLSKKYNLFYLEDPIQEEDFAGFKETLNRVTEVNKKSLIVGDDLTTTHIKDVEHAVESEAINAMIIKPNQVGSILEMARVVEFCKKNKIKMIFSHRSGETMDDAIADYCVGFGGDFLKCGIYGRERLVKLKRVIDIEKQVYKK